MVRNERHRALLNPNTGRNRPVGSDFHWRTYRMHRFFPVTPSASSVLLFGCGDGQEAQHLQERGYNTTAIDIRRSEATDVLCDGHRLPFRDEVFDAVLSMQVLEHLHTPWQAVAEISRVLKPGGQFAGSVAFMKLYHHSYFHMTHQGIISLFGQAGLQLTALNAAQSFLYATVGAYLPLGPRELRRRFFRSVDHGLHNVRVWLWARKSRLDPDQPTNRFNAGLPLSFRQFDLLRAAPAIVFQARKSSKRE